MIAYALKKLTRIFVKRTKNTLDDRFLPVFEGIIDDSLTKKDPKNIAINSFLNSFEILKSEGYIETGIEMLLSKLIDDKDVTRIMRIITRDKAAPKK